MWVRISLETYIFILNFSLPPRSEQVNGAVANEIKHVHSPEVIVVLDPRYDLSYKALYISTCSIALKYTIHVPVGSTLRGLFKKFCYERLSTRKDNVCLTDFVHKYSSFFHTCTCEILKESSEYQYSYWHLKRPQSYTLAYIWRWKGRKRWTRRC